MRHSPLPRPHRHFPASLSPCGFGLLLFALAASRPAAAPAPLASQRIMPQGYYLREPTDRNWKLRLVGTIASLSGAYLIVHNEELLYHDQVRHGEYTAEKPFLVSFAADGKKGDYKVILVGNQDDYMGLQLPISDLPFEVYGGQSFAFGESTGSGACFQATRGATQMAFGAYKGSVRVLRADGQVLVDSAASGKRGTGSPFSKHDTVVEFAVQPGTNYRLETEATYFHSQQPLYLAIEATRWFEPKAELDAIKWWNLVPLT